MEKDSLDTLRENAWHLWETADSRLHIKEKVDIVKIWAEAHPMTSLAMTITLLLCSIPFMLFVTFVGGSIIITFMGFLFVEGAVLSIAMFCLGCALCVMGFLSAGVVLVVFAGWLTFHGGQHIIDRLREKLGYKKSSSSGQVSGKTAENISSYSNGKDTEYDNDSTEKNGIPEKLQ